MDKKNGIKKIHIFRKIIPNGVNIYFLRRSYDITYPLNVWKEFPVEFRQNFADSLTYFLTMHLVLDRDEIKKIVYHFPPPIIEPFFFKGMIYSLGETALIDKEFSGTTASLIKFFYNKQFNIEFSGGPRFTRFKTVNRNSKKRAIIPFSFGKDSLLTFALARELGIHPYPIFFQEPRCPYENRHKKRLIQRFLEEFDVKVNVFPLSAGWLREVKGDFWGWDLLLTQYTLLLLPFLFGWRAKYLFWAHEQSCNDTLVDESGFIVNPVFEQSKNWLLITNSVMRALGCNSIFSSIIEPLYEIAIMKILHFRYPEIAKYQMSCFAEEKPAETKRWCGICSKCARIYIFLRALGISPKRVGFNQDMLSEKKRHLYCLFNDKEKETKDSTYDQSGLGRDEQLLAFYLAYKKGVKGSLIRDFEKKYLREARRRERELRAKFFGIHSTSTIPLEIKTDLLKIYQEELKEVGGEIK